MPTSLSALPFSTLLESLASKTPTPGGGAAACAAGALGAALAQMVVAYSLGKKSLAAHQPALQEAHGTLARARTVFLELADEDAEAYGLVNELMKLPPGDARRAAELPMALQASIQVPMAAIATCTDLLRLFETLAPITNPQLKSDLAITAVLVRSAAEASEWNVRVNAGMLEDTYARDTFLKQSRAAIADARTRCAAVESACGA